MELEDWFRSFLSQKELLQALMLVCAAVVAVSVWRREQLRKAKLPPGPRHLPIIGHLHLLGGLPHQSLFKLARIHGPLMSLRLGSTTAIVASAPEVAKEILQTHDHVFASRARNAAAVHLAFDRSSIGFAPYGPYWKHMRQLCNADLFSKKRLEGFRPIREEEVGALLQAVLENSSTKQRAGKQIMLRDFLLAASNNIISRMTVGKRFSQLGMGASDSSTIIAQMSKGFHLLGVFNVGDYIPLLESLDLQGYVRQMKSHKQIMKAVLQEVIDARRDERRANPCDLLDVLLLSANDSKSNNMPITDENIMAVLQDMFAAGTDTSAVTVEWALAELLANPMAMNKVQEELDSVVGNTHLVQESHIPHLPYLHATVKETMRLHPVAPLLVPHESTRACQIMGYLLPARTRAYVNVWAIGRDPNVWGNPLVFLPERFLESNVDVRGKHFQLLPFGSGRRGCPGLALGLLTVQLMLASLLQCFDWSLPTSNAQGSKVDMSETFGLTVMMANPLRTMATPRLPKNTITSNNFDAN